MAIGTPTDRGTKNTTAGSSSTNTLTSNSFSPTGGNRVIVVAGFYGANTSATFSVSDTFTGTGTWTQHAVFGRTVYTSYQMRVAIWSAVLGGTPGTGTITLTRTAGTIDQLMFATFIEVSGTGGVGNTKTNNDPGATLTITMDTAPAATSLVFGCNLGDASGSVTQPTGWTEVVDSFVSYNAVWEVAYKNGSSVQAPAWTASDSSGEDIIGAVVEFTEAGGGGTTVTPGVASLSLSTFAPKANLQINGASPTALSLSAFAPQANLRINGASPTALALSAFAPVLDTKINGASPTALSLSAFAPQANLRINGASPTALALSAFAPVLDTKINGASPTALSLSTFAPTAGLGPLTCTPDVLALALSTFAPTVSTSGNQTATPGVLALALATFAPQLQLTLTPALVALTLATSAPSLGLTVPVGLVTLALSTFAPPLDFRVTPAPGALVTATFAPTIVTPQTVTPGVAALVLTRYAPVITGPAAAAAPGYAFLSDEPTARASVFDSRMAIATLSDAVVGRAEVMDGGA